MAEQKESSVLFSLKELMNLEEDRIRDEEAEKAKRAKAESLMQGTLPNGPSATRKSGGCAKKKSDAGATNFASAKKRPAWTRFGHGEIEKGEIRSRAPRTYGSDGAATGARSAARVDQPGRAWQKKLQITIGISGFSCSSRRWSAAGALQEAQRRGRT